VRDAAHWDARYAANSWLSAPSTTVVDAVRDLPPGDALDLAAGTGRHALWLAERDWQVTAVDFSAVGLAQGRAADPSGRVAWVHADVGAFEPEQPVDLVLAAYVQLGAAGLRRTAEWLAPGGVLVVVGHALRNLTDGVHGPKDPAHLHTEAALREGAGGLEVLRLEEVLRPDEGGTAVELVLVARREGATTVSG
jgi:SAM-dependent methyltransferase